MAVVDGRYEPKISTKYAWAGDKILEIDAMHYDKCVKCLKDMFEVGWRYSEK
jgi:hypothetical protein